MLPLLLGSTVQTSAIYIFVKSPVNSSTSFLKSYKPKEKRGFIAYLSFLSFVLIKWTVVGENGLVEPIVYHKVQNTSAAEFMGMFKDV